LQKSQIFFILLLGARSSILDFTYSFLLFLQQLHVLHDFNLDPAIIAF